MCSFFVLIVLFALSPFPSVRFVGAASENFVPDTVWHLNDSVCLFNLDASTPFPLWTQQLEKYGDTPELLQELCLPGFYCPYMDLTNNATWPASCQPTPDCAIRRVVNGEFCDLQCKWEPVVCPIGYYCPTPNQMITCPSGSWCGFGSVNPVKCAALSICPSGSIDETYMGSLLAVAIVDVVLFLLYKIRFWYQRHQGRKFFASHSPKPASGKGKREISTDDGFPHTTESRSTPTLTAEEEKNNQHGTVNTKLIESFMKARGELEEITMKFEDISVSVRAPRLLEDEDEDDSAVVEEQKGVAGNTAEDEKDYVKILSGVSGSLESGRLTAVMGPAGCGKTTLLSSLLTGSNGWNEHWCQSGSIVINGTEAKSLALLTPLVGHVSQEDILHKELTVRENVLYSAAVRLPASWTRAEVEEHVDLVLEALQLTQIRDTVVGDEVTCGVSGGQRKRTNIAIELAAAPALLLLDEVTAGLDAHVALQLVGALQKLARAAKLTVGMVLQQPRLEIWRSLDQVLLMAAGGRTVYLGPPRLAERYFYERCGVVMKAFDNPANAIIDAVSDKATGAMLAEKWARGGARDLAELSGASDTFAITRERNHFSLSEPEAVVIHVPKAARPTVSTNAIHVRPHKPGSMTAKLAADTLDIFKAMEDGAEAKSSGPPSVEKVPTPGLDFAKLSEQLNGRSASFFAQVWEAHKRALSSQIAKSDSILIELCVCVLIGCIMGVSGVGRYSGSLIDPYSAISPSSQDRLVPEGAMYMCMTISLAASVAGVSVFGNDIAIIHREADAGHSMSAFYIGHAFAQVYRQLVMALHFATCYHVLFSPQIDFGTLYAVVFLLFFSFYAIAQIFSFLFQPINATIVCSMVTLMVCMFNGYITDIAYGLKVLFVPWWASEVFFSKQVERLAHIYKVDELTAPTYGYSRGNESRDLAIMFALGFGYQLIGLMLCVSVFHHRTAKLKNKLMVTVRKRWKAILGS